MSSPPDPFVVADLSDLHVGEPATMLDELIGPADRLERAVARLNAIAVDAVVITGDLVDRGLAAEYERLRGVLEGFEARCILQTGNHDDLARLRDVFPVGGKVDVGHLPEAPAAANFVIEDLPLRIVGVDTVQVGFHHGALDKDRLGWLAATLAAEPSRPTLLCLHHVPVATGMWWMDYTGFAGADELEAIVAANPQIVRVLAGHIHRATDLSFGGTVLGVSPAMTYQSTPALSADAGPMISDASPTIPLIRWDGARLIAMQLQLDEPTMTLDLRDVIEPWDAYEAAAPPAGRCPPTASAAEGPTGKLSGFAGVAQRLELQPSKLAMRVRFPSPALCARPTSVAGRYGSRRWELSSARPISPRPTDGRVGAALATFLVIVLAVAATGCGDANGADPANARESTAPHDDSVVADRSGLLPPGSPLTPDIQVQKGSQLVGRVFPWAPPDMAASASESTSDASGVAPGWQAVLVVDDDPVDVWGSYASVLGVGDVATAADSCTVESVDAVVTPTGDSPTTVTSPASRSNTASRQRYLTEARVPDENLLTCSARARGIAMFMRVGETRSCVTSDGGSTDCTLRPVAHLLLRVGRDQGSEPELGASQLRYERWLETDGGTGSFTGMDDTPPIPDGPVVAPDLPEPSSSPRLPGPGDVIDDGIDPFLDYFADGTGFTVPPGGRSLIAPALLITCNSGLVAALRVPMTPDEAIQHFDRAVADDDPIMTSDGETHAGNRWVTGMITTAGGYYLGVTAVAGTDGSDVLLDECGD